MAEAIQPDKEYANKLAAARAERELREAERAGVEAEVKLLEKRKLELELIQKERIEDEEKAKDKYHHVYQVLDVINAQNVRSCIEQLMSWHRRDPGCSIEVIFNSPGGSVTDGMHLFDFLRWMSANGHHVTTVALGIAASMAGILLQAGDTRVMGAEAWVLIHEAAFATAGKTFENEDRVEWVKRVQNRILEIFARRCAQSSAPNPLTKRQIASRWKRKDWWLDSDECQKYGLVDRVRR